MTAEEDRGRRGQDDQIISNRDSWERRGARQGDREAESEGWSVRSNEASDEETEEDRIPAREQEGSKDTLTLSPWGTQEIGTGGLQVDTRAGRRDEKKAPSATADEAGTRGHHVAREGQG